MAVAVDIWFARAHVVGSALFAGSLLALTGWAALRPSVPPARLGRLWRTVCGPAAWVALFTGIGTLHLDQRLLTARWAHLFAAALGGLLVVDAICQFVLSRGHLRWMRPLFGAAAALTLAGLAVGLLRPGAGP